MPTPSVGKNNAPSMRCSSITFNRMSRSRYAGSVGSSSPNSSTTPAPPSLFPRKYCSRLPGLARWLNVGFGMNRFTRPPTSSRVLPSISAHCIARLAYSGSM